MTTLALPKIHYYHHLKYDDNGNIINKTSWSVSYISSTGFITKQKIANNSIQYRHIKYNEDDIMCKNTLLTVYKNAISKHGVIAKKEKM